MATRARSRKPVGAKQRAPSEEDDYRRALSDSYRAIFDVVARIPRGKVMTYGQVAEVAGLGRAARLVGYAMHALGTRLPWQRVLGMRGRGVAQIAIKNAVGGTEQRLRLEAEGVTFSSSGGVELARYGHLYEPSRARHPSRSSRR